MTMLTEGHYKPVVVVVVVPTAAIKARACGRSRVKPEINSTSSSDTAVALLDSVYRRQDNRLVHLTFKRPTASFDSFKGAELKGRKRRIVEFIFCLKSELIECFGVTLKDSFKNFCIYFLLVGAVNL